MPERTPGQSITQMKKRCYSEPNSGRRSVRRPEDIQRDVRGLKLRQRVTVVLNDDFVRHELEDTVGKHGDGEGYVESVRAYQDFLVPSNSFYGATPGLSTVLPINDIRGTDTLNYTKSERNLRCKLAAAYRLVDMFGWSQNINGNLTVRCPPEHGRGDNFLIKPLDLLYSEVTASTLIKIDAEGNIVDGGSTNFGIDRIGFLLHSPIHMSRKDAKCIIHVHEPSAVAVAATKHGVLPISFQSLYIGQVSYHDYEGVLCDEGERGRLANNFLAGSKVLILRNHGLVCAGETIEEALFYTYMTIQACKVQLQALSAGIDNLNLLDKEVENKVREAHQANENGVKEFEAWMRMLDSQGYRTGYVYHNPDLYNKTVQQPKSQAKSPATMTSMRYEMMFGDNQTAPTRRARSLGKGNTYKNRAKWLNSPVKATEYRKEIIHDNNHSEPTILKDSRPEKDTVVKILEESKSPFNKEKKIIQEKIGTTKTEQVKNEIPLEDIFNEEDNAFVEKGLNDAETKEVKPTKVMSTEVTTIEVKPTENDGTITEQVVTTSTTVVKGDDTTVTTVEEKVVVNVGNDEEQPADCAEVEEKADEGSDDGEEKGKSGDKGEAEGGKTELKPKKRKSFKKTFQGMMHRRSKNDKDEDEEKS